LWGRHRTSNASNCSALLLSRLPIPGATSPLDTLCDNPIPRPRRPPPHRPTSPRKQEPKQRQWLTLLQRLPNLSGEGIIMIGESVSGACFEPVNPQNACPTPWSELRDAHVPHPHIQQRILARCTKFGIYICRYAIIWGVTGKPDGTWRPWGLSLVSTTILGQSPVT
jgi:hypothetical protein